MPHDESPADEPTSADEDGPVGLAVALALLLPVGFGVVYWGCAWAADGRADALVMRFEWERHTPLVPWMLLPYLSLHLLFLIGLFLCDRREQLWILTARLLIILLVAGAFFIVMPVSVNYSDTRYETPWVLELIRAADVRHNALPSLHAAIAVVLWRQWAMLGGRILAGFAHIWFPLVLLSTVLTHQHHVVDAGAGAALAAIVLGLVRPSGEIHRRSVPIRSASAGGGIRA